eukprot:c44844_g1_i1 orf=136-321(-)
MIILATKMHVLNSTITWQASLHSQVTDNMRRHVRSCTKTVLSEKFVQDKNPPLRMETAQVS